MTGDKWHERPFNIVWTTVYHLRRSAGEYTWTTLILFNIYTNDLPLAPQKWGVQSYVDDSKLVISFTMKGSSEAFADLRDNLHSQWCSNNLIAIEPKQS